MAPVSRDQEPPGNPGRFRTCLVNDPTPTPLNYRTAPYGKILGSFGNGVHVDIVDETSDQHGKPSAYVSDDEG